MTEPRSARPGIHTGPHPFQRLRRFFNRGRCRACYLHKREHPVQTWTVLRPIGDRSRAFGDGLASKRRLAPGGVISNPPETLLGDLGPEYVIPRGGRFQEALGRARSRWRARRGAPELGLMSRAEAKRIAYPGRARASRRHGRPAGR